MSIAQTSRDDTKPLAGRPFEAAIALVVVALALLLTHMRLSPPPAAGPDADPATFSAGRARTELERLLGEGAPRPAGSVENQRVRQALLARLTELGYEPETQAHPVGRSGTVARPVNIVATLAGREPGPAVAIAAHYDSVPAGPGAADDGAGIASILEIARALKELPQPRNTVVFLLTDAEETGLHGAKSFVERHALARSIRAVVNLEARGTSGPALLFETGPGSAGLIDAYASSVRRPAAGSAFAWIYERLPNDTDFTAFRAGGWTGVNLAFIEGVGRYHTPFDDLAHLDTGSLQHLGENAFGMIRALSEADLDATAASGEAVYFDVASFFVVRWPVGWTLGFALAALVALALLTLCRVRSGDASWRAVGAGVGAFLLLPLLLAAMGVLTGNALEALGALDSTFPANPGPALVAHWGITLAVGAAIVGALRKLAGGDLWPGIWIGWAFGAVALSTYAAAYAAPIAYPLVAPAVVAAVAGWGGRLLERRAPALSRQVPARLPPFVAALTWAPFLFLLPDAVGIRVSYVLSLPLAFVIVACAPLLSELPTTLRRVGVLASVGAAVVAAGAAAFSPPFTTEHPQPVLIRYHHDADAREAWWAVYASGGPLPEGLAAAGDLVEGNQSSDLAPSWARRVWSGPAPIDRVYDPPRITRPKSKQTAAGLDIVARLESPRGATRITLTFPEGHQLGGLWLDGMPVVPHGLLDGGAVCHAVTVPPQGIRIRFVRNGTAPMEIVLSDETPGLPAAGLELLRARGARAAPWRDADATIVTTRVRF